MWRSSLLVYLQAYRLIASNFTIKWTPSQVFFNSISSPHAPPMYWLKPPHHILKSPPHVLNTCGKPCTQNSWIEELPCDLNNPLKFDWQTGRQERLVDQKTSMLVVVIHLKRLIYNITVTYPGRLWARYTGLGAQTLVPKKGFLTSFFTVAIQQRNTLKKLKWLRRQKINRRHRIKRRDCLQKCFHSFK